MKKILSVFLICLLVGWSVSLVSAEGLSHRRGKITEIEGDVFVRLSGADRWVKAQKDMILSQDAEIKTERNSFATIIFDEKGSFADKNYDSINIDGETELTMSKLLYDKEENVKTTLLKLNLGKIVANAAKLEGNSKFEVKTPTTIVGVRGTKYEVEYRPTRDKVEYEPKE